MVGGTISWMHGNHLGVPIAITDANGDLAAPSGYTPVGFPGQTRTLSDLYYNRYRDYDPTTGRYIQADPIGLEGGSNSYLYANGNPLSEVDPSGLSPSTGAVIRVGAEWFLERQIKRAATRRIPIVGQALTIGDAIGATLAIIQFLHDQSLADCPNAGTVVAMSKTTKQSRKEIASDYPDLVDNYQKDPEENCHDFAKSILDDKYGAGNWKKGANTEYNKIVKACTRGGIKL